MHPMRPLGAGTGIGTIEKRQKKRKTMLVLTRRERERLKVGDDVTVTVVGIRGNEVRLGFEAPRSVPVHREEVYERIRQMTADELRRRIDQELL